jgi:hypothetical protein
MKLPKELYRIVVHPGEGQRIHRTERGGGTYHRRVDALNAYARHTNRGRNAVLYVTECDWKEV